MAQRKIVWTQNAELQLQQILLFFIERNKSGLYSQKLYQKFKVELLNAAKKPEIGIQTKLKQIRGLIVLDYILFYEIFEDKLMVLKVWDCRQNPNKIIDYK